MYQARTTCPYCGVGCGVLAQVDDDRITGVAGDSDHPANYGRLCVKGSTLHETLGDHGRLLRPRVEVARRLGFGEAFAYSHPSDTSVEALGARDWPGLPWEPAVG